MYSKTRLCLYISGQIHALATLSYVKELPFRFPSKTNGGGVSARAEAFEKKKVLYPYQ